MGLGDCRAPLPLPTMKLFLAGLSYKTAPVEVREKLAMAPGRFRCSESCSCPPIVPCRLAKNRRGYPCKNLASPGRLPVTIPQAPGTYTFAVSVQADRTPLPFLPVGKPTLFAPVAHTFTAAACQTPVMQQQIPPQVTPALYFVCP